MPVAGDPPASGAPLLPGALAMDDRADSLLMTVHLLADSGRSSLLQQALDRLLAWICPDVRLFLVSERATPPKYYERYCRRSRGFPGMAVLLFLHEDLGAEGILQVQDIFQHPPWRYQRVEVAPGPSHPYGPARHDFYTLDEHMPVWGVRRVRRGPEVLRVTLYCSWDNYEDAVRLYETILREEAAAREGERCVFEVRAAARGAVRLCLARLPAGVPAEPRAAALLQFRVRDMGRLVPLLPHPCVPISSTRWQTQDYEGNQILLWVQGNSKYSEKNDGFSNPGSLLREPVPVPFPTEQRSRALGAGPSGWRAAPRAVPAGPMLPRTPRQEPETNMDTGCAVVAAERTHCPLDHFHRDLRSCLLQPPAPGRAPATASSRHGAPLCPCAANGDGGAAPRASGLCLQTSRASPGNGTEEDEEEEFFI